MKRVEANVPDTASQQPELGEAEIGRGSTLTLPGDLFSGRLRRSPPLGNWLWAVADAQVEVAVHVTKMGREQPGELGRIVLGRRKRRLSIAHEHELRSSLRSRGQSTPERAGLTHLRQSPCARLASGDDPARALACGPIACRDRTQVRPLQAVRARSGQVSSSTRVPGANNTFPAGSIITTCSAVVTSYSLPTVPFVASQSFETRS